MPKQTNAQKSTNTRICDLCDGPFKATEQVLHCEGSCDKFFHRYCAGISKGHYQDLLTSSTPFVCLVCTQQLYKAELSNLHSEIAALKQELCDIRKSIQEAGATNRGTVQELITQVDELRSTVTTQPQAASPRPDATNQHSSKKSRAQRKKCLRRADLHKAQCESAVPSATREKESVPGSRKLWGTLRAATASVVSSTIGKLTTVGKHVEVKRKYKLRPNGSTNNRNSKWWFILRGSEDVLKELEGEWERVQLQTNWQLMPCLKYVDNPPPDQPGIPTSPVVPTEQSPITESNQNTIQIDQTSIVTTNSQTNSSGTSFLGVSHC